MLQVLLQKRQRWWVSLWLHLQSLLISLAGLAICPPSSTLVYPGTATSIGSALIFCLCTTTMSGRRCSITWSVWIFTSYSILTFSLSIAGSVVCWYHCCEHCTVLVTETPVHSLSNFVMSPLVLQLGQLAAFTSLFLYKLKKMHVFV